jgi:hypothetical protein
MNAEELEKFKRLLTAYDQEPTPMVCPRCGGALQLLMVRQHERMPILC